MVGSKFSTKDRSSGYAFEGGWWHQAGHVSNLNGRMALTCDDAAAKESQLMWDEVTGCGKEAIVTVSMKLKPFEREAAYDFI